MNMRFAFALLMSLAFVLPLPASADAGQAVEAVTPAPLKAEALQPCPQPGDKKLDLAQTSPAECCKGQKGVCGCRAGKIVCCDGTASTQPGCTCHGDNGFLE